MKNTENLENFFIEEKLKENFKENFYRFKNISDLKKKLLIELIDNEYFHEININYIFIENIERLSDDYLYLLKRIYPSIYRFAHSLSKIKFYYIEFDTYNILKDKEELKNDIEFFFDDFFIQKLINNIGTYIDQIYLLFKNKNIKFSKFIDKHKIFKELLETYLNDDNFKNIFKSNIYKLFYSEENLNSFFLIKNILLIYEEDNENLEVFFQKKYYKFLKKRESDSTLKTTYNYNGQYEIYCILLLMKSIDFVDMKKLELFRNNTICIDCLINIFYNKENLDELDELRKTIYYHYIINNINKIHYSNFEINKLRENKFLNNLYKNMNIDIKEEIYHKEKLLIKDYIYENFKKQSFIYKIKNKLSFI